MIKALAKHCAKFLNMFPPNGGVSEYFSPRAILTNKPLDYNNNCTHPFGTYFQANHESNPTNTPAACTLDCIYLDSNNGPEGGFELLHLATNKPITCHTVTEVPVTDTVITLVEQLAHCKNMPSKLQFITQKHGKFSLNDNDDLFAGVDYNHKTPGVESNNKSSDTDYKTKSEDENETNNKMNNKDSINTNKLLELQEELKEHDSTKEHDTTNQTIIKETKQPLIEENNKPNHNTNKSKLKS